MNTTASIIWNIRLWISNQIYRFPPHTMRLMRTDIPYACQFASKKHVQDFIEGTISTNNDPLWKQSGAQTKEEYSIWAWNGCGMACLQMILASKKKKTSLVSLGNKCLQFRGYTPNDWARLHHEYKNWYNGLFYKPFLTFVSKEFGLTGRVAAPLTRNQILIHIEKGDYVIASVSNQIRSPKSIPAKNSGHLVLIVGFDMDRKELYIHNPSGYFGKSQEYAPISFVDFEKFFSHRGMVLHF